MRKTSSAVRSVLRLVLTSALTWVLASALVVGAAAQPAAQAVAAQTATVERVTFDEAVRRALANNPTAAEAAQAILRAEGLLQQARAAVLPNVRVNVSDAVINAERGFNGFVTQPQNQATFAATLSMPVLAASQWAAAAQARDQVNVASLSSQDVRRQIAVATAQAYLTVIAQERQVNVNQRARDSAQAHLDYAQRRLAAGAGSRLNELRAAQEVTTDEARLENTRLAVRRAQEALGVLIAASGPVDVDGEPVFDIPPALPTPPTSPAGATAAVPGAQAATGGSAGQVDRASPVSPGNVLNNDAWMADRTDVQFYAATARALERIWRDSRKDYLPTGTASFDPQWLTPAGAFVPSRTWRLTFLFSQPVFDGGQRRGISRFRQAAAEASKARLTAVQIQARSEVRLADEAVRSTERARASLKLSAEQAAEVLQITTTAFEAGATTNLEVIDAQRSARDAASAEEIAEDGVRRARLDLLTALGRFPR